MSKRWLAAAGVALPFALGATAASAQTTTVPGEQVGLAAAAPLPEGVYAINTFTYRRTDQPFSPDTSVNIPLLVWSTPWKPLDANLRFLVAAPTVFAFTRNPAGVANRDISINVGTFVSAQLAWDLGGNVSAALLGGVYLNDLNGDRGSLCTPGGVGNINFNANAAAGTGACTPVLAQLSSNTYRFGTAISYTGDGWDITANLTGNIYDSPGRFPGTVGGSIGPIRLSDSLNLDLTATKKFGKFEVGAVGYGTVNFDISQFSAAAGNRGRFALGGLIGYDFGPFTAQFYVARDVATGAQYLTPTGRVRDKYSTDGWFRLIAPLYTAAPAAPAPVTLVRKY